MSIKVLFTDRFQRDIRRLSKRYYSKTSDQILLLTIYSKSDQSSIDASEVREIITDAEALLVDSENTEEDSGEEQL
jgi:mRNA-degrading endonuclease RelE of RelBE toxin-antitoxin system